MPIIRSYSQALHLRQSKPLGVIYELSVFVGDNSNERPHKRNSVTLAVRKVQYSPISGTSRQPSTLVSKGFALSSGKVNMEVTLDKELYYHGDQVTATLNINNGSKKTVKSIKCSIIQHVEVTMTNSHFTREVASLESKEGCPITPGTSLQKTFNLTPLASSNKSKVGIALDGKLKDSDANLASSTVAASGRNVNDSCGIIVSYSMRVKANCGAIGGDLTADLCFKLMHPTPGESSRLRGRNPHDPPPLPDRLPPRLFALCRWSRQGAPRQRYTGGEDLEFEDFARLRRGVSVDQP
ncbi:putative arrestin-like [Penaeus vannamei]|uniref:Putative arrestin-like n=1 Tax=Penaeus vannamei TaxID=6689 RepID=A0A423U732_PENVA|nr:putative arrestin-like [Penaeus vannamei]